MKEWQKELYIYRLSPVPPRKDDLQEYIELYLTEKDEKYLSWFLHYYEPTLNTTVMGIVQRYAMFGHFLDIKEACVLGILRALEKYNPNGGTPFITYKTRIMWEEIHNYIRTMRTGFTVQSNDEYQNLRNVMLLYAAYNSRNDPETLKRISDEVGLSEKTVSEILRSGFHNMQFVDFYRSYADEDSEESREDVTCDYTFEPFSELLRQERSEAVFGALDELSYREREVIRSHIGFCPDCHSMKSPKFRPHTFQKIAYKNELSSAEAAENIYHKGLDKMRDKLKKNSQYFYKFGTQKERSWCDLGTALEYNECRQTAKNCLKFLFWRHSIMYFDAIAKIVSERTGCDVSAVKPESKFSELGIDSLDTVELLMNLEDEIGIEIELDQKVETIDDLDKFIQSKQG